MKFLQTQVRSKLDKSLHEKLITIEASLPEIEKQLSEIDISRDQKAYAEMAKKHSEVSTIVELFVEWKDINLEITDAEELLQTESDEEMKNEFEGIVSENKLKLDPLIQKIKISLLPKDPSDDKDVLVEIRPGAGGEEAAIWVGDLYKMYTRFAERNGWNVEPIELTPSDQGGYSKIIFAIKSKGVFSKLKFEAGAHRVQRIPKTESQGRVHTSIATVAVLPEAEEVDLNIVDSDLKIDVYRSSGPGGQSVNTTDSAVRITHIPTGLVVTSQDEKSQLKNKNQAMRILRARLLKAEQDKAAAERAKDRKEQVGSGERSDKIRTYNYKDNRVSDHRINLTLKKLDQVLDGDLEEFVVGLIADNEAARLANLEE
ncbi:MAG: peptide chain release factor 1 [Candidatus Actinomarina sp.]|jgi:peptide chain release factor 1